MTDDTGTAPDPGPAEPPQQPTAQPTPPPPAPRPGPRPGPAGSRPVPTPRPASVPKPHPVSAEAHANSHAHPVAIPVVSDPSKWGRVDDDGTAWVRTADGERQVGSWQAGDATEGLAHFGRRFDDLATEVALLEARLTSHTGDARKTKVAAQALAESLPTAAVIGDIDGLAKPAAGHHRALRRRGRNTPRRRRSASATNRPCARNSSPTRPSRSPVIHPVEGRG